MSTTSSVPVPIAQSSVSIPGIEVERVASQIKEWIGEPLRNREARFLTANLISLVAKNVIDITTAMSMCPLIRQYGETGDSAVRQEIEGILSRAQSKMQTALGLPDLDAIPSDITALELQNLANYAFENTYISAVFCEVLKARSNELVGLVNAAWIEKFSLRLRILSGSIEEDPQTIDRYKESLFRLTPKDIEGYGLNHLLMLYVKTRIRHNLPTAGNFTRDDRDPRILSEETDKKLRSLIFQLH